MEPIILRPWRKVHEKISDEIVEEVGAVGDFFRN